MYLKLNFNYFSMTSTVLSSDSKFGIELELVNDASVRRNMSTESQEIVSLHSPSITTSDMGFLLVSAISTVASQSSTADSQTTLPSPISDSSPPPATVSSTVPTVASEGIANTCKL